jgi:hypothetical protein
LASPALGAIWDFNSIDAGSRKPIARTIFVQRFVSTASPAPLGLFRTGGRALGEVTQNVTDITSPTLKPPGNRCALRRSFRPQGNPNAG